jgi:hypothetical protein
MLRILANSVAALALVACSAAAQPVAALAANTPAVTAASAPIACTIRATPTRHGVLIEALARTSDSVSGEYQMVITKRGRGGASDITQGGEFSAGARESLTLGSAEIGLDRGDSFRAVLRLRDGNGPLCEEERQS